jgi:microcin C transport system permease protein
MLFRRTPINPINQRRWRNFKANRRGWWSLWIFLLLFLLSMCANFLANDKPLLIYYKGSCYFPVVRTYPETAFGGSFPTETDYRDPYAQKLIKSAGWMLWPPIRYSYSTYNQNLTQPAPSPPTSENWLGTDDQARDVAARLLYGFRISVLFGLALTFASSIIGIIAGGIQGFYGGRIDISGQRFIEIWEGLPVLFLLIILSSFVKPNFWWLIGIMLLFSWMALVDVVRAEFLRGRNLEYVRAARTMGAGDLYIMFRHVLPNAMISTTTFLPFILNGSITTLTSLDFLGFGMPVGSPSLGDLLAQGKSNLQAPWIGISTFIVLALLLSLLVFIGEAARDAFDPRQDPTIGGKR